VNSNVNALAVSAKDLCAAGAFTNAGGSTANYISKWDGSNWSPLASGVNRPVNALAISRSEMYAGGSFTTAGGKVSAYVAQAYLERPTVSILRSGSDLNVSWPAFYGGFELQETPDVVNTSNWSNANHPLSTNGATISTTVPLSATNQFFRLIGN
jgi:hypothetical protein